MKTKIKVEKIADPNINIPINSALHKITEIKKNLKQCFTSRSMDSCEAPVFDMWSEDS